MVADKIYIRELIAQVIYASITGIIVDYNNFRLQRAAGFLYRTKALFQKKFYVIVYYDDGEVHIVASNLSWKRQINQRIFV
jgi:hypothetical protein